LELQVTGLDEALRNLMRLNVDESLENKALTKAGEVTKESILNESKFSKRTRGTYKKNVRLKRPKDGEVIIHSGKAFHAHLIEFGRSGGSVITKKGKKVTWGPTAPNPVFGRGYEGSKNEAMQTMISEIQKGLGL
jgi:HK97 gp10 family phage protein